MQLHTNVPGIGDSLWDLYIHPWQHYLQSRGCELRLTTVLQHGQSGPIGSTSARLLHPLR